ncbi:MAG: peptidoglycan DD-metalloendopeptidase family protein [Pseudomonadota bacterium]
MTTSLLRLLRISTLHKFAFALLLSLAMVAGYMPLAIAETEAEYEQQLKQLSRTIDKLQKELTKTQSSRDELQQSLQQSEQEISSLLKRIESIKEALSREKKQLSQHQRRRAELETSRQQQQQQINRTVRQAYSLGQQSQIKLLLNQEQPYRVSRLLRYHDYIVAAHKQKMDEYIQTIEQISVVEQAITDSTQVLEENQQELNQRFRALKATQAARLVTLTTLNNELTQQGDNLSRLRSDQQRLEKLLEEATKALSALTLPSDAKPFRQVKGTLAFPTKGRITKRYGAPRLNGKLRWNGLFIIGNAGTPVSSVYHGRVIFSDYLRGHGLLLIIDHGSGYMSLYAHNQTLLKETGDWVSSGDVIATLGNTGGQSQAGLYFEIRHDGKPQNPRAWLSRG